MMFKQLILISWNHTNTKISFREQLALSPKESIQFYKAADKHPNILELAILSTCNRMEFYLVTNNQAIVTCWIFNQYNHFFNRDLDFDKFNPSILIRKSVIEHLFRVASGMESMIVGEKQILKQVQFSSNNILKNNNNSSLLIEIFSEAVKCGDSVHNQTQLGSAKFSICREAVKHVIDLKPEIITQKILIIGSGETAELITIHFIESGAQHITISNRNEERGRNLSENLQIGYTAFLQIKNIIKDFDMIVTATHSIKYLINQNDVQNVISKNNQKEIIFIDISSPRNIDPSIKDIKGMTLIDIDNLKKHGMIISAEQKADILLAKKLVKQHLNQYSTSWHRQSVPDKSNKNSLSAI